MQSKVRAKIFRGSPQNINRLARALARGELVATPSETVYGLAGNALDVRACRAIFRAKGRPTHDPLIVHVASLEQLETVAVSNRSVAKLAKAFWPGPLTIILEKKPCVPDLATAGRPSVAVRIPRHPLFLALIRKSGRPLAAPSANPFGYVSPTSAEHVRAGLGNKIRYILDGGDAEIGVESTILDLRDASRPVLLRPGAIDARDIQRVLKIRVHTKSASVPSSTKVGALAPGGLSKHYSPKTPITLASKLSLTAAHSSPPTDAFLFVFRPKSLRKNLTLGPNIFWLAESGKLSDAAHSLFATMRKLDQGKWKRIHAERAPGSSALAIAINDRLTRAAAKR